MHSFLASKKQFSLGAHLLAVCALALLSACTSSEIVAVKEYVTPATYPKNQTGVASLPKNLKRVALLPIYSKSVDDVSILSINGILLEQLSQQGLFEVVQISPDQLTEEFGFRAISSAERLPAEFLRVLEERYAAQGVMFVDLSSYRPYKPMSIGMRFKLVDTLSGGILWAFDNVLNAGNPGIMSAARKFESTQQYQTYPLQSNDSILHSPARFMEYVTFTAFSTLPRRYVEVIHHDEV